MPIFQKLVSLLLTFSTAFTLLACGGGSGSDATPPPQLTKDLCFDNGIYSANAYYKLNFKEGETSPVVSGIVRATDASIHGISGLIQLEKSTTGLEKTINVTQYLKLLTPQFTATQPEGSGIVALYEEQVRYGLSSFITTIYSPPYEDRRAELSPSETHTFTGEGTRIIIRAPVSYPYTHQEKIKFVGVERITMPAGTFTACRYEVNDTVTEWWHRSLVIRRDLANGESRILQSGELNGSPLKSQ
jgi:hypothetical protein